MSQALLKAAVLGSPITHSLSPFIHNAAYKLLDIEGEYQAIEVKAGGLAAFLQQAEKDHFKGFSVTMPLKEEATGIASALDPQAALAQSVNTLIRNENGWRGFNTDITGIKTLISDLGYIEGGKGTVAILGSGGTSRAALAAVSDFKEKRVFRRSSARDAALRTIDSSVEIVDWDALDSPFDCDLLISTVPAGAIDIEKFELRMDSAIDAIYSPWPPPLTGYCLRNEIPVATGIDLLLAQAMEQIRLMTQTAFDSNRLRGEIGALLRQTHDFPQAK